MEKNPAALLILNTIEDYKKDLASLLRKHLSNCTLLPQQKQTFNQLCLKKLRKAFENIIRTFSEQQYIQILKSLLQNFFYGTSREIIKLSLILTFVDDIFECLSLKSLRQIFEIVDNEMIKIKKLQTGDQNTLLRITNSMLKRISRSQEIQFRGRLHISLSRILKLCHDSGLNGKQISNNSIQIDKISQLQVPTEFTETQSYTISYRFYQRFWGLQKYFNDATSLFNQTLIDQNIFTSEQVEDSKQKGIKMSLAKLKTIQSIIVETLKIFANNPIKQYNHNSHQPIKYLTRYSLLITQLNDSYFRKLFLIQGILFCFNLNNITAKSTTIVPVISEEQKSIILQIQRRFKDTLEQETKRLNEDKIGNKIQPFLFNQRYWVQLKQCWKQKKKTFFRKANNEFKNNINYFYQNYEVEDEQKRNLYFQLINPNSIKTVQKQSKIFSEIMERMKIQGIQFLEFIKQENGDKKNLQNIPLLPSFQYYYDQSVNALENFERTGDVTQNFQRKNIYTIYQWKALKSLYRQNLKEVSSQKQKKDPNAQKYKQYKLLYIVKKREDQSRDPIKKVKLNE